MADQSFTIALLLKPALLVLALGLIYGAMWLLWKWMPNGWLKRLLFFRLWGKNDPAPWVQAPKRISTDLGRIRPQEPASLPQRQSQDRRHPPSQR